MSRRRLLLAALLVLAVALSGCADLVDPGEDRAQATELRDRAVDTTADVDTYTFELSTRVEGADGGMTMNATGAVDQQAERMRMEARMDGPIGTTTTFETYLVGETAFVHLADQDEWVVRDVASFEAAGTDDLWSADELDRQRTLLADAEVTVAGEDEVRGTPVTVIEVDPDEAAVENLTADAGVPGAAVERAETTQWITDEGYVLRSVAEMELAVRDETVTVETVVEFDDFDEPVDVEVPDGAPEEPAG